ncbi:hypothetical protein BAU15_00475 [Enterococcus sp. JM4C]|uniref:alpha/beta hydrolase n=1 Tax=Candidatus Enterococcus huntleyi TaxID=1857217 RepID=UPI00137B577E|nr:alpha/beta hydrolase [Enterococcus sp. JM4C]KAF1299154.1 hypothetical protein BAU15_00475 [Enterococcus sp. JM4C]
MTHPSNDSSDSTAKSAIYSLLYCDKKARPCVIIFPGGGYQHLAIDKEGTDIQAWAYRNNYHSVVLSYQVPPESPEDLFEELEEIIRQLQTDPLFTTFYFIGFSAGAHLACSLGTRLAKQIAGLILCYPVVTFTGKYAHIGSARNFLGASYSTLIADTYSLETLITPNTPPCFIWHTTGDQSVPVENSLILSQALINNNVPVELHLFPNGRHGMAMRNEDSSIYQWISLAEHWLNKQSGGI